MARKRAPASDEDYAGDSDEEYRPGASRTPARAAKRRPARGAVKRHKRAEPEDGDTPNASELDTAAAELQATRSSHPSSVHTIAGPVPLRAALLDWYAGVHATRGMPWRKPFDPSWDKEQRAQRAYEVWISEIMLQQTQVATVIPYYLRWMERYPTIGDLAASNIEVVNHLWKGLGYYSRAARLLSGAQKTVAKLDGRLPNNARDLEREIPGIGRYSAGAICSIAYNECVPVLDGNVHRLLSRVLVLHAPPKSKQTLDILWAAATALVDGSTRPGDLNQALIELGSTVCKVRDPSCSSCPLRSWCQAYKLQGVSNLSELEGRTSDSGCEVPDIEESCTLCELLPRGSPVTSFPMKVEKKRAREELDIVNVIEWRRHIEGERWFLLVRRPEGGLLAGLHEFPTSSNVPVTTPASAQTKIVHTILSDLLASPPSSKTLPARTSGNQASREMSGSRLSNTLRIVKIEPAGDVLHVFSHIRKTYRVQWVVLEGGGDEPPSLAPPGPPESIGGVAKQDTEVSGKHARAKSRRLTARAGDQLGAVQAAWTPIAEVASANVGTGVMKVWKLACSLWDDV